MLLKSHTRILVILLALLCRAGAQNPPEAAGDERAIREIEERWDAANLKGDAAVLEGIFADEFILTGADGKVHTRAEVIRELRTRNIQYQTARTEELSVMLYENAAVVSGRWRGRYTLHGKAVNLLERFTNFYVRRGGKWQCVASHGSAVT